MTEFPSTQWSAISRAKHGARDEVERLFAKYRPAVRAYIGRKGHQDAEAEDLTQEVFLRLIDDELLARADRARGRFRAMLMGITKNVIRESARRRGAAKRGGDKARLSLDETRLKSILDAAATPEGDADFDREWARNLLDGALKRLETEGGPNGVLYARAIRLRAEQDADYNEIADALGRTLNDARNFLHRGREALQRYIDESVREYSGSRGEFETEVRLVSEFLPKE